MLLSPAHSQSGPIFPLLGLVGGVYLAIAGSRIISRREGKIGPKGRPHTTVYGVQAVYVGLGFIMLGLFFSALGAIGLAKVLIAP